MERPVLLFGDMAAYAAPPLPVPLPRLPEPHETTPTYPEHVVEPGELVLDAGPPGEGTASGTLTLQPAFALPVAIRFRTERHEAMGGQPSTYSRETSPRRAWQCTWPALTTAERGTLVSQLRAAMETPINWTPPGDAARVVKVRLPGPADRPIAGAVWEVSAILVEVRT
jgi:hypothetical protein